MKDTTILIAVLCDADWIPWLNDLRVEYTIGECEDSYYGREGTE